MDLHLLSAKMGLDLSAKSDISSKLHLLAKSDLDLSAKMDLSGSGTVGEVKWRAAVLSICPLSGKRNPCSSWSEKLLNPIRRCPRRRVRLC